MIAPGIGDGRRVRGIAWMRRTKASEEAEGCGRHVREAEVTRLTLSDGMLRELIVDG